MGAGGGDATLLGGAAPTKCAGAAEKVKEPGKTSRGKRDMDRDRDRGEKKRERKKSCGAAIRADDDGNDAKPLKKTEKRKKDKRTAVD